MRFRRWLAVWPFAVLVAVLVLAGCSSLPRTSYTASDAASSTVLDLRELPAGRRWREYRMPTSNTC
jgi:uncharacterized lipoprotein